MMNNAAQIETAVTANQIPTASRINALPRHFHWLRDYALDHPEAGKILAAID